MQEDVTAPDGFRSALTLFDADDTSADDQLYTVEGDRQPEIHFDWAEGVLKLRVIGDPSYLPERWAAGGGDRPYTDPEGASFCTQSDQPFLCFRVTVEEVVP